MGFGQSGSEGRGHGLCRGTRLTMIEGCMEDAYLLREAAESSGPGGEVGALIGAVRAVPARTGPRLRPRRRLLEMARPRTRPEPDGACLGRMEQAVFAA